MPTPVLRRNRTSTFYCTSSKLGTLIDLRDAEEAATIEDNANLPQYFVTVDAEENPMPTFKTRRLVGAGMSEISKRPELKLINERILKD